MSERWTYQQEKIGTLLMMYDHRRRVLEEKRTLTYPAEDIAWVSYEGENVVRAGLDLLINNIVYLVIIEAAMKPENEAQIAGLNRTRAEVQSVIDETPIEELLNDVPKAEAHEIRTDLEILGLIPQTWRTLREYQWSDEDRAGWEAYHNVTDSRNRFNR